MGKPSYNVSNQINYPKERERERSSTEKGFRNPKLHLKGFLKAIENIERVSCILFCHIIA